ncbi:MAG: hypothetical protein ABJ084_03865 [Halioglobus sp.]
MAVETVELIPLGNPALGMTRAEMLEYSNTLGGMASGAIEVFYTVLFAYVIAMFIAGRLLTRTQYVFANIMYVVVIAMNVAFYYQMSLLANVWITYAGLNKGFADELLMYACAVYAVLVILSIWFGRKVRHPTSELPQ